MKNHPALLLSVNEIKPSSLPYWSGNTCYCGYTHIAPAWQSRPVKILSIIAVFLDFY